jgi:hypothetical protein
MPPWAQRPLGAASAVCGAAPWGFSAADALAALEDGVADTDTHGDHAIALRGAILAHPVPQVRPPNAFINRRVLCLKHWRSQPRLGVVLILDLPPLVKDAGEASTTPWAQQQQRVVEMSTWESTVLVRTRALSGNASVAAMRSPW